MTFEVFIMFMDGLLFICGLFAWYMAFDMYQKFVLTYGALYELAESLNKHSRASGGDSYVQTKEPQP